MSKNIKLRNLSNFCFKKINSQVNFCFGNGDDVVNTYYNDGVTHNDPDLPVVPSTYQSKGTDNGTYPSCITIKLIVYYDLNFKEGIGGGTTAGSEARYVILLIRNL